MSMINSTSNSSQLYTQATTQVSNTQGQPSVHHHHHHWSQSQDSIQLSKEGSQGADSSTGGASSILSILVANGTITQNQENSIEEAFKLARQSSATGTYSSSPTNPISSLVANGTITQDQATSIKSAFKSAAIAHHHYNGQQTQDATHTIGASTQNVSDSLLQDI